jgi:MFS transporter, AAHS family, 4-hydroxybenzoate transporter
LGQVIAIDRLVDGQRIRWFNVSLLIWSFLAMFADGYDIGALSFAQPELQSLWHVPKAAFGPASSASLFGILLGAPLLGWVGDRFGRKTAIVAGSIVYGLSSLAVIATHNLDQVMALRFVTGVGLGGLMPNTIALNSELAPMRLRATLITLMFAGITLGSSAPGLIAYAWMPHYGWRVLFLVGGLVPLTVAVCLIFALPESVKYLALHAGRERQLLAIARRMRPDLAIADDARFIPTAGEGTAVSAAASAVAPGPRGARDPLGLGRLFAGGLVWITPLLWACFATALMSNYFLNSFLPLIFRDSGMPAGQAALAATLYHVGGTVGGLLMSVLLDRFGFVVIALLFVVAAPAIAALGVVPTTFVALAPLATLSGLAVLGAQFGNNAAAGLLYPTAVRSKGVGWALGIGRFGAIVGPLAGGVLLGMNLPLHQLFLAAAAPMVVGAIAAVVLVRLCYARLGGLRLSDVPMSADSSVAGDASASMS